RADGAGALGTAAREDLASRAVEGRPRRPARKPHRPRPGADLRRRGARGGGRAARGDRRAARAPAAPPRIDRARGRCAGRRPLREQPVTSGPDVRRILCVRLDSLGDVLMTGPALRALTRLPGRPRLTLLASPPGAAIAPLLPELDDAISYAAPWIKGTP